MTARIYFNDPRMNLSDFDYELPPELIAQEPLSERDSSRMLVVDRDNKTWRDSSFAEFPSHFIEGDLIVINNTRVFPARLLGHRILKDNLLNKEQDERRGGKVEVLLLNADEDEWEVLAKPGRALRVGDEIEFGNGRLRGVITAVLDEGRRKIRFECDGDLDRIIDEIGNTPLPPYIKRLRIENQRLDEPRYQTVYARQRGAIAAPTAGLHFTPRVFDELRARDVRLIEITHHVGYATFQPIRTDRIENHRIGAEAYEISVEAANSINSAKKERRRIIAIGTTTVRALESAAEPDGQIRAERSVTGLFIYPEYRFRVINALLTNFHLPQSSLLMLVSAFTGLETTLGAYRHAVEARYRFYSYGDCMLII
jgi:S-adenosylmethionine:tRNA ribosyltransferase-isomerase